jgi:protein CpxP
MAETNTMSARFAVAFSLGVLLTWGLTAPIGIWADPPKDMMTKKKDMQSEHGNPMHDFVRHALHSLLRHQKDLGLSDDQVSKLKTLAADYEKGRIKGEAEIKLAEVDVQALIHDEKAETSAIEAALKKSEGAHTALRLEQVKAMRATVGVLTPEQREKWRTTFAPRHGDRKTDEEYRESPKSPGPSKKDGQ